MKKIRIKEELEALGFTLLIMGIPWLLFLYVLFYGYPF